MPCFGCLKKPSSLEDLLKHRKIRELKRPPAWLVTGFPCLLEEALRFEEEVGRVALLVHLFGEIRLLLKTIKLNYKTRGMKIPSRLREHLIMFGEHLMPLLAAYDDRVEHVELVEDENLVFQELFSVVVHFDERKPSNNRPTTATQKVVDRLKLLRTSFGEPYQQNTSQELYLYSPYGPRSLILKSRKITPVVSQHMSDDQSISDEQTATPTLARLGLLRPPSRPSMNEEELEMTIKSPSVTRMEGPSDTKSSDNEIIITPILKHSSPSSETSHTKPKTKSKLSAVKKVSKPIIKRVNLPS